MNPVPGPHLFEHVWRRRANGLSRLPAQRMQMPKNEATEGFRAKLLQTVLSSGWRDAVCAEIRASSDFLQLAADRWRAWSRTTAHLCCRRKLRVVAKQKPRIRSCVQPDRRCEFDLMTLPDIGAQTILTSIMESAEQALALLAAMRYPSYGDLGIGNLFACAGRWEEFFIICIRRMNRCACWCRSKAARGW